MNTNIKFVEDERNGYIPDNLMHDFMESLPDGVLLVNTHNEIKYLNKKVLDIFDYERYELIGKNIQTLIPKSVHLRHEQHVSKYLDQPKCRTMQAGSDLYGLRKDGQKVFVSISLNIIDIANSSALIINPRNIS